ncbi:hypothetical protein [Acidihalobacter ferrooxydans]|uniref:Type 1 pili tip component n=1 Tax=Acidihalobacter ferrooxydans TaxID=1765967 RepID=A0A1P8UD62_9GAMM|nr:hypothetical protein [Acidihalobacter ferrooxydans]APZ41758.1 hypothetical protein BW247_00495 [Acidihalobacter ferrooxydans]
MKIKQLVETWQEEAKAPPRDRELKLSIASGDLAKLQALSDLYGRDVETLACELLEAALYEVTEALPYVPGKTVVGEDECGDPIYEDAGLTPRFLELTRDHLTPSSE